MHYRLFLLGVSLAPLAGCQAMQDYFASEEGKEQTLRGGTGVFRVIANPADAGAWVDIGEWVATLAMVALGIKVGPKAVRAAAPAVKTAAKAAIAAVKKPQEPKAE